MTSFVHIFAKDTLTSLFVLLLLYKRYKKLAKTVEMDDSSPVLLVLEWAGPLFFFSMQLSLLHTAIYQIALTNNEKKISSIPFLALLTNSSVWAMYGLLTFETPVLVPNAIGTGIGAICVFLYYLYSNERIPVEHYFISALIIIFCFGCGYFKHYSVIGSVGVCSAIFLMGSPLSTLKKVIEEKSTQSMPSFSMSVTTWLNAFSWSLYGIIVAKDFMVYAPNLIGLLLASVQLFLYAWLGFPSGSHEGLSEMEFQNLEVGKNPYITVHTSDHMEERAIHKAFPTYS